VDKSSVVSAIDELRTLILALNPWTAVDAPNEAFIFLPFVVQKIGRYFRPSPISWQIDLNRPMGKAYFVSTTGNDANDGLTSGTAFRKISTAYLMADVDVVYIETGIYGFTNGWTAGGPGRDISFIATGGRVVIGNFAEGLSWSADGNAYKATRSHVQKIADATQVDALGDWTFLTLVDSAATCKSTPGSWYTDATYVWVRTIDSRSPDTDIRCYFDNVLHSGKVATANSVSYFENIDFEGGSAECFAIGNPTDPITGYFNDCTYKYGTTNGFGSTASALTFNQDCVAARNGADGFNYHKNTGSIPYAVEINCIGRNNGTAGDTIDNGSTMHDGGVVVRLMTEAMHSVGRPIHDIGIGTKSWNLGVYSHDSDAAPQLANFGCGTGVTDTIEMWLDSCLSLLSTYDIEVVTGCTVHTREFIGAASNIGAGTIDTY
jgi:hypothetical protein